MKSSERPRVRPDKLMDGFYIEVSNKGSVIKGVRIRSDSRNAMEDAAKEYAKYKTVLVLGEYKDDAWRVEDSVALANK